VQPSTETTLDTALTGLRYLNVLLHLSDKHELLRGGRCLLPLKNVAACACEFACNHAAFLRNTGSLVFEIHALPSS